MQLNNNFTQKTQQLIAAAGQSALSHSNQQMEPLHILEQLLEQEGTLITPLLQKLNISSSALQSEVKSQINRLPKVQGGNQDQYVSHETRQVLTQASKEAQNFQDEFISVEHILLAMLEIATPAKEILKNGGLEKQQVITILKELRGSTRITDDNPEDKFQALEKYCQNFTELARQGKIDPVIGRTEEIRQPYSKGLISSTRSCLSIHHDNYCTVQ